LTSPLCSARCPLTVPPSKDDLPGTGEPDDPEQPHHAAASGSAPKRISVSPIAWAAAFWSPLLLWFAVCRCAPVHWRPPIRQHRAATACEELPF
jgi:hypothetical protein